MRKETTNKLSKLFSLLLILAIATTDVVPFISVAVDITKEDKEIVEEITEEITELEEEIDHDMQIEVGVDGDEGSNGEEELRDTEEVIEEPQQTNMGIARMSMSTQSTPTYVMATDADFSGTSNGNFRYIGKGGYIEIPHKIKGVNVNSYSRMFNNIGQGVQGVKSTNKNVTNMYSMFSDFKGSSTLNVSQLDTTNVTNMAYMFQGTTQGQNNITNIIGLENFNTSKVTDFSRFMWRSRVDNPKVYNFDTSRASNMEYMFGDSWTTKLDIRNFNTSNVRNMGGMFQQIRATSLDLSNFDTSRVEDMRSLFYASNITDLRIGKNFKTHNVTDMRAMFREVRFTGVDLSGFDTSRVTDMGFMFTQSRLSSIDVSGFDTRNVTTMAGMFENSEATNINMGGSFNTTKVESMNSMFMGSKATTLDLRNFNTSNVKDMIYMFRDSNASNIDLGDNFNTSKVEKMSRMFTGSNVDSLDLTGFNTRNVTDMELMFAHTDIRDLNLSRFSTSRITDMSGMFLGLKVERLNVSNFDTTYVTDMSRMFEGTSLSEINLTSFDMASVNNTDDMFKGSTITTGRARTRDDASKLNASTNKPSGLTFQPLYELAKDSDFSGFLNGQFKYIGNDEYVEIPKVIKGISINSYKDMFMGTGVKGVFSNNTNVTDMSGMFKNTTSDNLDVLSINTDNVTSMSGMFEGSRVKSVDLTRFDTSKVTNMSSMFRNTKLEEVDLGSFDLTKVSNTTNMFNGTTARVGYARTQTEVNKLNSSSNKPSGLVFSVWGITTTQSNNNWTNKPIDLTINAVSGDKGVSYVEMVNETGRNYALNSETGALFSSNNWVSTPATHGFDSNLGARWMYGRDQSTNQYRMSMYVNSSFEAGRGTRYSEDLYPVPDVLTYSIDVMSPYPMRVGFRGGKVVTLEPNQWVRLTATGSNYAGRPEGIDVPHQPSVPLNTRLYYKNYKIEKGTVATPWKPAPEDSESSSEQTDKFAIYNNGTYIFRATDTTGETKIVSHTVTNIDTTQPTAEITPSTSGWTSQDVEIYVNAKDDLSGVDYITMPDGTKVSGNTATYVAKDNKKYTFKITDKAGNTTTYTEEVNNIDRSLVILTTNVDKKGWVKDSVNISITSEESATDLEDIKMINSPDKGENLLKLTGGFVGVRRHGIYYDEIIKENGKEIYRFSGTDGSADRNIIFLGRDDYNLEKGKEYTFSFYAKASKPLKLTGNGVYINGGNSGFMIGQEITTEWERYSFSFTASNSNTVNVHMYPSIHTDKGDFYITEWKLEEGNNLTPWTPSPKEMKLNNNSITYPVPTNGLYTFKASYENGATSEVSVNVSNIDLDAPTIKVNNNPTDWTEEDEIELEITALDDKSGVKSITLPDGTEVKSNKATYKVSENGQYEFTVIDNVGNKTKHTETVDRLMMQYGFYIYDSNNKPLEGAVFELLVDGETFKTSSSGKEGYVDFGKVPPTWRYSIRQISSPDGSVLPGDIEVEDPTDPVEVINYPRGEVMPSTGTMGAMVTVIMATLIGVSLYINIQKKQKVK